MPYLNLQSSRKLQETERTQLSDALGDLISLIPGKSDDGLMVRIEDDCRMRFRGVEEADCIYVDIRLYMTTPYDRKNEFAKVLLERIQKITGVEPDDVYMSFSEYGNWVVHGKLI